MPAIFSATERACFGSQASSPISSLSFLPSTPPAALISATASSAPSFICFPKVASPPVIGPATPMAMSCPNAEPANARLAPSASPISRNFFIVDLPSALSAGALVRPVPRSSIDHIASGKLGKRAGRLFRRTVAPAQRSGAFIQPRILRDHLGGTGGLEREGGDRKQEQRINNVGEQSKQIRLEQRKMHKAHGCAEQRDVDEQMPERSPSLLDGS